MNSEKTLDQLNHESHVRYMRSVRQKEWLSNLFKMIDKMKAEQESGTKSKVNSKAKSNTQPKAPKAQSK